MTYNDHMNGDDVAATFPALAKAVGSIFIEEYHPDGLGDLADWMNEWLSTAAAPTATWRAWLAVDQFLATLDPLSLERVVSGDEPEELRLLFPAAPWDDVEELLAAIWHEVE
jgi:histidinol dehydrogenase